MSDLPFSRTFRRLIAAGSLVLILSTACTQAPLQTSLKAKEATAEKPTREESLKAMQAANVVYLGERHDSEADHAEQLFIIQALHRQNPKMAIALEMFQRPFQSALDQFVSGELSEAELIQKTEYETRWGFPWEFYAPILRYARDQNIPVLALNAPAEVVKQVSRQGLDSLQPEDFQYIPPREEIDTSNENYRTFVQGAFGSHGSHGNFNFDNFFAAQVVWDETMADRIATFHQSNSDTQIIVLAGQGHVIYGYGIPDRVERRLGPSLSQQIVLLNPSPEIPQDGTSGAADIFWHKK